MGPYSVAASGGCVGLPVQGLLVAAIPLEGNGMGVSPKYPPNTDAICPRVSVREVMVVFFSFSCLFTGCFFISRCFDWLSKVKI